MLPHTAFYVGVGSVNLVPPARAAGTVPTAASPQPIAGSVCCM